MGSTRSSVSDILLFNPIPVIACRDWVEKQNVIDFKNELRKFKWPLTGGSRQVLGDINNRIGVISQPIVH